MLLKSGVTEKFFESSWSETIQIKVFQWLYLKTAPTNGVEKKEEILQKKKYQINMFALLMYQKIA